MWFNFILQEKKKKSAALQFSGAEAVGVLCFHLLLVANNNSANGFENRKFPSDFVVFPLSGEMVLRIYNTLILLLSLAS